MRIHGRQPHAIGGARFQAFGRDLGLGAAGGGRHHGAAGGGAPGGRIFFPGQFVLGATLGGGEFDGNVGL